jgi:hypothetical protein
MIIGLTGKKECGKDTVGRHLVHKHGFERVSFAYKLKQAVAALFDLEGVDDVDELKNNYGNSLDLVEVHLDIVSHPQKGHYTKSFTWREFLQRFGTEMGRNTFGKDFWVDQALPMAYGMEFSDKNIVVTDVRFENEALRIVDLGGRIIEIRRPTEHIDPHESEAGLPADMAEYVISNDSTLESLYKDVDAVLENIYANR